jgi:radical SAM-linked protein
VILRAARRAGIPIAFSNGHHPLPRLAFGPALPLCSSSDDEYLDVDLTAPIGADALVATLSRELPPGLEVLDGVVIDRHVPSIDASMIACVWEVDVTTLDAPPAVNVLEQAVATFDAASALLVQKVVKGKERTVDARPFVRHLALAGDTRFVVEIAAGLGGSIKPSTLVGQLLGLSDDQRALLRVHKTATRFRDPEPATARSA